MRQAGGAAGGGPTPLDAGAGRVVGDTAEDGERRAGDRRPAMQARGAAESGGSAPAAFTTARETAMQARGAAGPGGYRSTVLIGAPA